MAQIDEAVVAMLAEVEAISKNQTNMQQNYKFRGIDDVYNAVHPLLSKHGVYPTCEILSLEYQERVTAKGGTLLCVRGRFRYTFHARDGSATITEAIGEAMDSGDKASNKAMSNAYKYAIFQLLCIPTMAVDGDAESPEPAPPPRPPASAKSFGAPPAPPKPKPAWATMSDEQRKNLVLATIAQKAAEGTIDTAWHALEEILKRPGIADLTANSKSAVTKAAHDAKKALLFGVIERATAQADPNVGLNQLHQLAESPRMGELDTASQGEVAVAMVRAERKLDQECSGQ